MIPIAALGLTAIAGILYLVLLDYRARRKRTGNLYAPRTTSERIAEGITARASGREPVTPLIMGHPPEIARDEHAGELGEAPEGPHLPDAIAIGTLHDHFPLNPEWEGWLYLPAKLSRVTFDDIDYHVHSLSQLPSNNFPALKEIERDGSSADDVCRIIQSDWNLSVRILKLANSAFYSMNEEVSDVKRAITLLGFETVRSLIYVNIILDSLGQDFGPISARPIFQHCLATSCAATFFANGGNPASRNLVATAGLFHDIGKLVCAKINRLKTEAALDAIDKNNAFDYTQLEKFGISHYLITKLLLDMWHFPAALTGSIIGLAPHAPVMTHDARALKNANLFASHIGYTACGTEMDTTDCNFRMSPERESQLASDIRSKVDIFTKI